MVQNHAVVTKSALAIPSTVYAWVTNQIHNPHTQKGHDAWDGWKTEIMMWIMMR